MDGKIAWLLWPRHELSPVSACFLLAAFHNSFILWWRHGPTCIRVLRLLCDAPLLLPLLVARTPLSFASPPPLPPPLSFYSRMMNNNRGTVARIYVGSVVPLIYERTASLPSTTVVRYNRSGAGGCNRKRRAACRKCAYV